MTITYLDLILAVTLVGSMAWLGYRTVPLLWSNWVFWRNNRWAAKSAALAREHDIDMALLTLKNLVSVHKDLIEKYRGLATDQATSRKVLEDYSQRMGEWSNRSFTSIWAELAKKENKLSDDDKFLKDAELSNQITRIAQHSARKAIQDDKDRESLLAKMAKPMEKSEVMDEPKKMLVSEPKGSVSTEELDALFKEVGDQLNKAIGDAKKPEKLEVLPSPKIEGRPVPPMDGFVISDEDGDSFASPEEIEKLVQEIGEQLNKSLIDEHKKSVKKTKKAKSKRKAKK